MTRDTLFCCLRCDAYAGKNRQVQVYKQKENTKGEINTSCKVTFVSADTNMFSCYILHISWFLLFCDSCTRCPKN